MKISNYQETKTLILNVLDPKTRGISFPEEEEANDILNLLEDEQINDIVNLTNMINVQRLNGIS